MRGTYGPRERFRLPIFLQKSTFRINHTLWKLSLLTKPPLTPKQQMAGNIAQKSAHTAVIYFAGD